MVSCVFNLASYLERDYVEMKRSLWGRTDSWREEEMVCRGASSRVARELLSISLEIFDMLHSIF
jgi:hypothetical protein